MNFYLLRFFHRKKSQVGWFRGFNAGEGINKLEAMGVDTCEAIRITSEETRHCLLKTVKPLEEVINYIKTTRDYKPI